MNTLFLFKYTFSSVYWKSLTTTTPSFWCPSILILLSPWKETRDPWKIADFKSGTRKIPDKPKASFYATIQTGIQRLMGPCQKAMIGHIWDNVSIKRIITIIISHGINKKQSQIYKNVRSSTIPNSQ